MQRTAVGADTRPRTLGKRGERLRKTVDETVDARPVGQPVQQLGGDVDGELRGALGSGIRFGLACAFDVGFAGGTQLVRLAMRGGEDRGLLGLGFGCSGFQCLGARGGKTGCLGLCLFPFGHRVVLRGLRVIEQLARSGLPGGDHVRHRLKQEA